MTGAKSAMDALFPPQDVAPFLAFMVGVAGMMAALLGSALFDDHRPIRMGLVCGGLLAVGGALFSLWLFR